MLCLQKFCSYFTCCCRRKQEGYNESTFYDAIDPNLVYIDNNLGEIREGVSFIVDGRILPNCERFTINLVLDSNRRDVALHINPRLPQNYIVRNSCIKNVWGQEEVTSALPFILRRGKQFTIQILVTEAEYLISINGRHFAFYSHRLPYKQVKCLEVKGDVEDVTMDRVEVSEYPSRIPGSEPIKIRTQSETQDENQLIENNIPQVSSSYDFSQGLPMPFFGVLMTPFVNGQRLFIEGRVKILPHSFYINLQTGQNIWPHPIIAFHLNPRFATVGGKQMIIKNSWFNGKWDKEERSELKADFLPGNRFTLKIYCTTTAYEVYLNNKFIAEYEFRTNPKEVDTVYIQGDIKIWQVEMQSGTSSELAFAQFKTDHK